MHNSTKIYVELLEEGTRVWRPVAAELQADDSFLISEQEVPEDEQWQFLPGERVMVEKELREGEEKLIAVHVADSPQTFKNQSEISGRRGRVHVVNAIKKYKNQQKLKK